MTAARPDPPAPPLAFVMRIRIEVGAPIDLGRAPTGHRRLVPITGGGFEGPGLRGRVLPGGADVQLLASGTLTELDAQYAIETDRGVVIAVRNRGLRAGAAADIAALVAGREVPPEAVYFRSWPRLTTADASLAHLNERLFVGRGLRRPDAVELEVFELG